MPPDEPLIPPDEPLIPPDEPLIPPDEPLIPPDEPLIPLYVTPQACNKNKEKEITVRNVLILTFFISVLSSIFEKK